MNALLDLRDCGLMVYSWETCGEIHERYGGRVTYTSRTGLSGSGYIEKPPYLRVVHAYRTDVAGPLEIPIKKQYIVKTEEDTVAEEALPHVRIAVPYSWGRGSIDTAYPVIVESAGHLVLSSPYSSRLRRALSSEVRHMEKGAEDEDFDLKKLVYEVVPAVGAQKERFEYEVVADRWIAVDVVRKVVRDYYRNDLRFRYPSEGMEEDLFFKQLGLYKHGGMYYKIAGGICWDVLDEAAVSDLEVLKRVAPKNVYFIDKDTYLRSDGCYYDAVARVDVGGRMVSVEYPLPDSDAVLEVFGGDCSRLRGELEKVARSTLSSGCEDLESAPAGTEVEPTSTGVSGGQPDSGKEFRAAGRHSVLERLSVPSGGRTGVSL